MTQANNVATQCNRITALGVLKAAGGGTNATSPGTSGNVLTSTGTDWASLPITGFLKTTRYFTTPGIFTYTPNSGVSYIIVTCIGGGGGGGSSGVVPSTRTTGTDGSASYFGSFMIANGGTGGIGGGGIYSTYPNSSLGGSASGGDLNISGSDGDCAVSFYAPSPYPYYTHFRGGKGGSSVFGGAGQGGRELHAGNPGKNNTGGGGGASSYALNNVVEGGGGGGSGGYCIKKITSGFSGVSYQVGSGGLGGLSDYAPPAPYLQVNGGSAGGSGIVIVQEFS